MSQRSVAEDDFDGSNFVPDDEDANSEHDLAESSVVSQIQQCLPTSG